MIIKLVFFYIFNLSNLIHIGFCLHKIHKHNNKHTLKQIPTTRIIPLIFTNPTPTTPTPQATAKPFDPLVRFLNFEFFSKFRRINIFVKDIFTKKWLRS